MKTFIITQTKALITHLKLVYYLFVDVYSNKQHVQYDERLVQYPVQAEVENQNTVQHETNAETVIQ